MLYSIDQLTRYSTCVLIPTRPLHPFAKIELLNDTYEVWKKCWQDVANYTEYTFNADDFYRQDAIFVLLGPAKEIIGCHLYSFFNSENQCNTDFSFFKRFDSGYQSYLKQNNIINSFSAEYLTISDSFRELKGLSLARSLISLTCTVLQASPFDGILAQTRDDVKVNKMSIEAGGEVQTQGFKMNGIDSSFITVEKKKVTPSPRLEVRKFVDSVWSRRIDYTGMTDQSTPNLKHLNQSRRIA